MRPLYRADVGANAPPVLLRKGILGQGLRHPRFSKLGRLVRRKPQHLDHSDGLLARCRSVLADMDRLEHGRDLLHLRRADAAEDIAVPVHDGVEKARNT
jgi:hypothetical protein